jgi:hypothetical protein
MPARNLPIRAACSRRFLVSALPSGLSLCAPRRAPTEYRRKPERGEKTERAAPNRVEPQSDSLNLDHSIGLLNRAHSMESRLSKIKENGSGQRNGFGKGMNPDARVPHGGKIHAFAAGPVPPSVTSIQRLRYKHLYCNLGAGLFLSHFIRRLHQMSAPNALPSSS